MKILVEFWMTDNCSTNKAESITLTNEDIKELIKKKIKEEYGGDIKLDRFNFLVDFN